MANDFFASHAAANACFSYSRMHRQVFRQWRNLQTGISNILYNENKLIAKRVLGRLIPTTFSARNTIYEGPFTNMASGWLIGSLEKLKINIRCNLDTHQLIDLNQYKLFVLVNRHNSLIHCFPSCGIRKWQCLRRYLNMNIYIQLLSSSLYQ